jgi:hypothetical protein
MADPRGARVKRCIFYLQDKRKFDWPIPPGAIPRIGELVQIGAEKTWVVERLKHKFLLSDHEIKIYCKEV